MGFIERNLGKDFYGRLNYGSDLKGREGIWDWRFWYDGDFWRRMELGILEVMQIGVNGWVNRNKNQEYLGFLVFYVDDCVVYYYL